MCPGSLPSQFGLDCSGVGSCTFESFPLGSHVQPGLRTLRYVQWKGREGWGCVYYAQVICICWHRIENYCAPVAENTQWHARRSCHLPCDMEVDYPIYIQFSYLSNGNSMSAYLIGFIAKQTSQSLKSTSRSVCQAGKKADWDSRMTKLSHLAYQKVFNWI